MIIQTDTIIGIEVLQKTIKETLHSDSRIVCAYLFGSVARDQERESSDLDLALLIAPEIASHEYFSLRMEFAETFSRLTQRLDVDIVILNDTPVSLAGEILRTGKLLFSRDELQRVQYEVRTMSQYMDMQPFEAVYDDFMNRRIDAGLFGKEIPLNGRY